MAESLARKTGADIIQIHGSLEPENIAILKNKIYQRLIVAINSESQETHGLDSIADAILLDTLNNGKLGGSGKTHDWNMSAELVERLKVPVILAGGLNPNNVVEAVRKVRPYAVDVSSGVETDGRKDPEKINSFIREAKNCH
jgi:phosphoribosylanthranilate isomerase